MLGYITVEKPELKIREYELYGGYYCGVCKSIGRRYGQIPRMALSYDAAFLALFLAGLSDEQEEMDRRHCIVHPIKKKTVVYDKAVDFAADVMLILTWHKLLDDADDEGKLIAKALLKMYRHNYESIEKKYTQLCRKIQEGLSELHERELENCTSIDRAAHGFAKVMESVFAYGIEIVGPKERIGWDAYSIKRKTVSIIAYNLGKWIYIMDAWEDMEENLKTGAYNPIILRYGFPGEEGACEQSTVEKVKAFKDKIRPAVEKNLIMCLAEMGKAVDLLDICKNKGIIENIVYMGLLRRTEKALEIDDGSVSKKTEERKSKHGKSI